MSRQFQWQVRFRIIPQLNLKMMVQVDRYFWYKIYPYLDVDDVRLGTLIQTDTETLETVDDTGKQVKIVTKTEKYLIEKDGVQFLR